MIRRSNFGALVGKLIQMDSLELGDDANIDIKKYAKGTLLFCIGRSSTHHRPTIGRQSGDVLVVVRSSTDDRTTDRRQKYILYWKEKETHILNFKRSDLYWEHHISSYQRFIPILKIKYLNSSTNFCNFCWWRVLSAMTSLPRTVVHWLYVKETRAWKQITFEGNKSLNNFPPKGYEFNKK